MHQFLTFSVGVRVRDCVCGFNGSRDGAGSSFAVVLFVAVYEFDSLWRVFFLRVGSQTVY